MAHKNRSTMPRFDARGVGGLSTLMNPQHIDQHKTGKQVESEIMGRGVSNPSHGPKQTDIVAEYGRVMQDLGHDLGFDLDADDEDEAPAALGDAPTPKERTPSPNVFSSGLSSAPTAPPYGVTRLAPGFFGQGQRSDEEGSEDGSGSEGSGSEGSDDSDGSTGGSEKSGSDPGSEQGSGSGSGSEPGSAASEDHSDEGIGDEVASRIIKGLEHDLGIDLSESGFEGSRKVKYSAPAPQAVTSRSSQHYTAEQERRRHIDQVLGGLRDETHGTYGAQRERMQDDVANMLDQITGLRLALEEDGIDCKDVEMPNSASPPEQIESVLRVLRLKNDRNRCATVAEEVILGVGEIFESVFDGTREIPILGVRPDYTGFTNTLNVKLHRMRYETSQVVGDAIQRHRLGPMMRIGLELLPSFALYPRQRKRQRGRPGLSKDPRVVGSRVPDARAARSSIRARDEAGTTSAAARERRTLDDI